MAQFNQRNQRIAVQQYNAMHDISFKGVQNTVNLRDQLERLQQEVVLATQQRLLSEETGIDVEAQLKKALIQTKRPVPEKQTLLDLLAGTKALIETSTKTSDLIPAVVGIMETVQKSFP